MPEGTPVIRAVEGVSCVGKSTVLNVIRYAFPTSVEIFDDPGRHGLLDFLGPLSPRELQIQGLQHALTTSALLTRRDDVLLDRWILSNLVYDEERGVETPTKVLGDLVELANGSRGISVPDPSKIFLLHADVEVVLDRARLRGEDLTRGEVARTADSFLRWGTVLDKMGVDVHLVNANGSPKEVADEVRRNWK